MTITFNVPTIDTIYDYEEIEVEFEGYPTFDNDTYDDEYGTVKKKDYPTMAQHGDPTWDKTKYTNDVNNIIELWYINNAEYVSKKFCKQLEKDSEPDF